MLTSYKSSSTGLSLQALPMPALSEEIEPLIQARHHNPFAVLGRHEAGSTSTIRVFKPNTKAVFVESHKNEMSRVGNSDIYEWTCDTNKLPTHYRLISISADDNETSNHDPYDFAPQLPDYDIHLFGEGKHWHIYRFLGSHVKTVDGIDGVLFATWAPSAERVSVIGDFNQWDGRAHPMRVRGASGLWELFIPGLGAAELYRYEIRNRDSGELHVKTDPYAQQMEMRPATASVVFKEDQFDWQDNEWIEQRRNADWLHQPMSIYEVHLGSWQRDSNNHFLTYRELAHRLVDHALTCNFTHIELLPITEHPLDASWGYQPSGYFAATSRFGGPDDLRYLIDYCHRHNIGVLLDWVPGHFPKNSEGLARFDGSALYEHEDPRRGEHRDWGTLIFNYGRNEVKNFLLTSATFWLEEFHFDGLRVDAVASMLYLDYSREDGDWLPNIHGGNHNLEAIDFIRQLNEVTHSLHPGTLVMAEESTSWSKVSRPTTDGGLGFSMKWNMGWMNDTLEYMKQDPIHRRYHHNSLTFSQLYAYTENFILPLSHDEVVHGKGSLRYKMPGDEWQQFANLRLLYTYMYTHPGKKLLFMGCEFGQGPEWNEDESLDWYVLDYPQHAGIKKSIADLNALYRDNRALHHYDFDACGFEWLSCDDGANSVLSYVRRADHEFVIVILNFTPVTRENYRIGVPESGTYVEIFNSDSTHYSGSDVGNHALSSDHIAYNGRENSIVVRLPPLAGIILRRQH